MVAIADECHIRRCTRLVCDAYFLAAMRSRIDEGTTSRASESSAKHSLKSTFRDVSFAPWS